MIRISKDEYIRTRNTLDHIAGHLSENGEMTTNNMWMIDTIKDLLLDVYLLQHEVKSRNSETRKTSSYYVIKMNHSEKYFEGAWEYHGEDKKNYRFTSDLDKAMVFYEHSLDSPYGAPKYLWDEEEEKIIKTLDEVCEYFDGRVVKVKKQEIWQEV